MGKAKVMTWFGTMDDDGLWQEARGGRGVSRVGGGQLADRGRFNQA